jgi:NhaP-type Na+/H+ or K+/H+ antiporter
MEDNNNNNNNNSNTTDVVLNDASHHHQEQQQEQPPETATNIARAYIPSIAPSVPKGTATILLVFITWVMLYCVLGDILLPNVNSEEKDNIVIPGGAVFSLIFIWAAAHVGATMAKFMNVPPLLGMLLSGLCLRNVPGGLVEALPKEWSSATRAAGLSVILMRSGLELDLVAFKRVGLAAARLTVMPGLSEAVVTGLVATALFNLSVPLGLSLGFILAAVSPAVVVGGMFDLQARGYGVAKGIPSLVVAAASFDDVVAITGYTIMKSFAIQSDDHNNLGWTIMHGPTDVALGIVVGSFAGYVILGATAIWNKPWKRSLLTFELGMAMMFLGRKYDFSGGGAMASLAMGITANKAWTTGRCPIPTFSLPVPINPFKRNRFSLGPRPELAHSVEVDLSRAWRTLFQPLLFGVIGSAVKFADLTASTIPKSMLLLFIGLCIRLPVAYLAVGGGDLNLKERAFVALSWLPKATVQAALASDPLESILKSKSGEENYDEWVKWGNDILTTAVFSIILTAPVGMLIISNLGPKWLQLDTNNQQFTDVAPGSSMSEDKKDDDEGRGELMRGSDGNIMTPSSADGKRGGSMDDSPSVRRNSFAGEVVSKIASMVSSRNPSARHTPFDQSDDENDDNDNNDDADGWGDYENRVGDISPPGGGKQDKKKKKKVMLPRTTSAVFKKHMSIIANMEESIQDENQRREFAIAKMGVEAILKEHMPRDSEIETAGAFFRKTSVAEGKMDLAELEELGVDTSEMVENLAAANGGDVGDGDTSSRPSDYDTRKSPSGRRSPVPLQQVKEEDDPSNNV